MTDNDIKGKYEMRWVEIEMITMFIMVIYIMIMIIYCINGCTGLWASENNRFELVQKATSTLLKLFYFTLRIGVFMSCSTKCTNCVFSLPFQTYFTVIASTGGPLLGLFLLGSLFPCANAKVWKVKMLSQRCLWSMPLVPLCSVTMPGLSERSLKEVKEANIF